MIIKCSAETYYADPTIQQLASLLVGGGGRADWGGSSVEYLVDTAGEMFITKDYINMFISKGLTFREFNIYSPKVDRTKLDEELPPNFADDSFFHIEYDETTQQEISRTAKTWREAFQVVDFGENDCYIRVARVVGDNGALLSSATSSLLELFIAEFADFTTYAEFKAAQVTYNSSQNVG